MGGDSTFAIRVWIALGIVSYVYGIVWLYWTFQSEDLTRGQFANNVVWQSFVGFRVGGSATVAALELGGLWKGRASCMSDEYPCAPRCPFQP